MKKYDCSKVLDYQHEIERLCNKYMATCKDCPFIEDSFNCDISTVNQKGINILQRWSDEHPEKTRAEVFLEIFPKYTKYFNYPCFNKLIGKGWVPSCNNKNCMDCWGEPYKGEFEEARINHEI